MGETGQCSGIAPDERGAEPGAGLTWEALGWQGLKRSTGRS